MNESNDLLLCPGIIGCSKNVFESRNFAQNMLLAQKSSSWTKFVIAVHMASSAGQFEEYLLTKFDFVLQVSSFKFEELKIVEKVNSANKSSEHQFVSRNAPPSIAVKDKW